MKKFNRLVEDAYTGMYEKNISIKQLHEAKTVLAKDLLLKFVKQSYTGYGHEVKALAELIDSYNETFKSVRSVDFKEDWAIGAGEPEFDDNWNFDDYFGADVTFSEMYAVSEKEYKDYLTHGTSKDDIKWLIDEITKLIK